ncbi:MAG: Rieske 2Fe-2S domain-containing protein [Actinomycetota bacterium]|nr:Rieske 2Fe-2S domain-containing protein [Actinomycetota bacterium]
MALKRRDFLRVGLIAGTVGATSGFGAAALGFMWPSLGEGFGATLDVGAADELASEIQTRRTPFAYPAGRLYVVAWDPTLPGAMEAYGEEHKAVVSPTLALMALYQKCVHLGCRVPWCQSSQWFECPCHGSKYNKWGEWVGGPAPRGLDRFPSEIDSEGRLSVNTGVLVTGPARTERVLQQEPEGAHCINL